MTERIINVPVLEPSQQSYDRIWETLIFPSIKSYISKSMGVYCRPDARSLIWDKYKALNYWCKMHYMKHSDGKLDRHKTCACYIYAILQADVLSYNIPKNEIEKGNYLCFNEQIAVTVGLSLLRSFIRNYIHKTYEDDPSKKDKLLSRLDNGILLPLCNHGDYRENFVAELHFAKVEHNYNILSLANSLFLLEKYNLGISSIDEYEIE